MTESHDKPNAPDSHQQDRQKGRDPRKLVSQLLAAGLLLTILILSGLLWFRSKGQIPDEVMVIITGLIIALMIGAALLAYLGDDYQNATLRFLEVLASGLLPWKPQSTGMESPRTTYRLREADVRFLVKHLRATESKAQVAVRLSETDRATLESSVTQSLRSEIGSQLLEAIEAKYSSAIVKSTQLSELRVLGDRTKERLLDEVLALSKRSNLNLVIGIITTAAAVGLLAYIVLTSELRVSDWRSLIPSYVLRLSLVVFVEVFAFFFLRMYRVNLQEIKYFQNELTSIEAKFIALEAALGIGDAEMIRAIVNQLATVERNQTLQQGQSTVEIERLRLENGTLKSVLELAVKVVPGSNNAEKKT